MRRADALSFVNYVTIIDDSDSLEQVLAKLAERWPSDRDADFIARIVRRKLRRLRGYS
jgi:hypothetical protein